MVAALVLATLQASSPSIAPLGFLDLCRRSPADCVVTALSAEDAAAVSQEAGHRYWRQVFSDGREVAASAEDAALPAVETGATETGPAAADAFEAVRPALVETQWRKARAVNARVNRSIRARSDEAAFGQSDFWTAETTEGDCEDYALAKRRALIANGFDPADLSLALATTPAGESHALLLLADGVDWVVLDNLSPWLSRPSETPYAWVSRQKRGQPLVWVSMKSLKETDHD